MIATEKAPEPHDKDGLSIILRELAPALSRLDDYLQGQIEHFEPEVRHLVRFCFQRSGKRIRPILIFLSGKGGKDRMGDLVQAAAVVEMVHLATLVHDDILDRAEMRHGLPTVSRKFGPQTAVLLGDTLFAHAVHLSAGFDTTAVCRLVSQATRTVCSGEIAQTSRRDFTPISRELYFRLIQMKTAELFRVSCQLGALLAGHDKGLVEAAATYGNHLGIGYQIYDDLADFFGVEEQAGKTLGTDWASGKVTLPLILFLEGRGRSEREAFPQMARKGNGQSFGVWREKLQEEGIFEEVAQVIRGEIEAAREALEPYGDHAAARALLPLGDYLAEKVEKLRPAFATV